MLVEYKHCLICHNVLHEQEQISGIGFCRYCVKRFEFIHQYPGRSCRVCQKKLPGENRKKCVCEDCHFWERHYAMALVPNRALLYYNDFGHEVMERAKFGGDVALWTGVARMIKVHVLLPRHSIQVIPSSTETYQRRDFDHLSYIANTLQNKQVHLLTKKEGIASQISLRSVQERRRLKQAFEIIKSPPEKRLILFDDVYTSGSTLKDAQHLLEENQHKIVETRTIFRSDLK